MDRTNTARVLPGLLAAIAVLIAACGADEASVDRAGADDATSPSGRSPGFVVLLDDDSDPDQIEGKPGSYAMTARGTTEPPYAVVDVPAGFTNFGFFAVWPLEVARDRSDTGFRGMQYWTVYGVHHDPCRSMGGAPRIGDSVDDLADALVAQKMTRATRPAPVSLDGHDGVYLELTLPTDVNFKRCEQGYFILWAGMPNDAQHATQDRGLVERLWILDVAGERVVLVTLASRHTSKAETDELTAIAESARFVEPD